MHSPNVLGRKLYKGIYLEETSPSADMVRLYVNVQFQVKRLSTGTSSGQTKKIPQKFLN